MVRGLYFDFTEWHPKPKIYWYRDGSKVPESFISSAVLEVNKNRGDVVSSTYMVGIVQRCDVDSEFTCLASNTNMTQASKVTRILRMNLLPLHVHISSQRIALSAGSVYDIHCKTFGSRPSSHVTWWLGNVRLLDESSKTSKDGNVTESTLRFQPKIKHQGKLLRCRSENPVMPASQIEDTWHLDINYIPRVHLRLGSTLSSENIKEREDVYFECTIQSKPRFHKLTWKFNGIDIHQDLREGIIMGNQSLVLQGLSRNATGTYHCMASNIEGNALSNPVELNIKYKPVCADDQKMVYGIAHGEIASINCSVNSEPSNNLRFHWTFNSSSEINFLPESRYTQIGTTSRLVYSLNTGRDYGTILCWAENELGVQSEPCVFHLIPAVPPVEPLDCLIENVTSNGLSISCRAGFDGGVPQTFVMEIRSYNTGEVIRNFSSVSPRFMVDNLESGAQYELELFSYNAKGKSKVVKIIETTKKDTSLRDVKFSFSAESTLGEQGELKPLSTLPEKQGSFERAWLHPILTIVGGIGSALILVSLVIILALKFRCAMRRNSPNSSLHEHTWKTDNSDSNKSLSMIDNQEVDDLFQSSPGTAGDNDGTNTAATSLCDSIHPSIISSNLQLPPLPPPKPHLRSIPVAALSTLPKNFHSSSVSNPHSSLRFPIQLLQSFPSPPETTSFAVSALALDLGSYPEIEVRSRSGTSSMDPIESEILLPPPAECLYTLPRKKPLDNDNSKPRRSVRFDDIKKKTPGRRRKSNMESAV
ncbi:nephrin isoform X2 [Lepeophtheirus salmonis]|uniref:nephrin isoform X2 n=1 Tax=Lepeophtheirus salmonis TaxID=72036 RepID=UPI003AF3DC83